MQTEYKRALAHAHYPLTDDCGNTFPPHPTPTVTELRSPRCAIALAVLLGSYYPSPAGFASGVGVSPTVTAVQAAAFARPTACTPPRRNRRRYAFKRCSLADRRRSAMAHAFNSAEAGEGGIGEQAVRDDSCDPSDVATIGGSGSKWVGVGHVDKSGVWARGKPGFR